MTEFENEIKGLLFDAGDKYNLNTDLDTAVIDLAPRFLEAARKQIVKEMGENILEKECKDCWHNYHCPIPQEGYNYNPDTCPYNPDNKK